MCLRQFAELELQNNFDAVFVSIINHCFHANFAKSGDSNFNGVRWISLGDGNSYDSSGVRLTFDSMVIQLLIKGH